jgi:hypothetical protein
MPQRIRGGYSSASKRIHCLPGDIVIRAISIWILIFPRCNRIHKPKPGNPGVEAAPSGPSLELHTETIIHGTGASGSRWYRISYPAWRYDNDITRCLEVGRPFWQILGRNPPGRRNDFEVGARKNRDTTAGCLVPQGYGPTRRRRRSDREQIMFNDLRILLTFVALRIEPERIDRIDRIIPGIGVGVDPARDPE